MFSRSVVVVEDEDFLRGLLATMLENAGFKVATASNAIDARRVIKAVDPDALILDVNLGTGPTGFDIADTTLASRPEIAIVFLTDLPDPRFVGRSTASTPKNAAYLNKNMLEDSVALLGALEAVLTENNVAEYRHDLDKTRPFANLSSTQIQVIQLIAAGNSNQQIAEIRKRSLAATESVITRTLEALGIDSSVPGNARVEAVRKYLAVTNHA